MKAEGFETWSAYQAEDREREFERTLAVAADRAAVNYTTLRA